MAAGTSIYISGGCASILTLFAIIRPLFASEAHSRCVIGSSGGALLATFLSMGGSELCVRRRFIQLCQDISGAMNWHSLHQMLRDWVRDITGGAACTMKQWRNLFAPLHLLVYDYSRARPLLVDPLSNRPVAFVLACCLLHDTPSYALPPHLPETWVDVENVIPPCALCTVISPPVALHFTSTTILKDMVGCNVATKVLHLQERALSRPLQHLTWQAIRLAPDSNFGSLLHPKGWSNLLRSRQCQTSHQTCSDENECVQFALGFVAWVVALLAFTTIPMKSSSIRSMTRLPA